MIARRVSQLAVTSKRSHGSKGQVGILLLVLVLVFGFTGLGLASVTFEVGDSKGSFYVDAQVYTMYTGTEDDPAGDDSEFEIGMWNTSNVGLILERGEFKAYAEVGFGWPDDLDVYTRLLYGTWTTDAGTLTVGRAYTPYTWGTHEFSDNYNAFSGHGSLFDWRQTQLKFALTNGLYLAVIDPSAYGITFAEDVEIDSDIPKLAVGYDSWGKIFSYGVGAAFQTYKETSSFAAFDESINSGFIYLHGLYNINEQYSLSLNTHFGQNLWQFGAHKTEHQSADLVDGQLEDTMAYGGFLEGSYKHSDNVKLYGGVAYTVGDNDGWDSHDDKLGLFVNSYITFGKYLTIVPEISYTDNLNDKFGEDQADEFWIGITWQIKL